MKKAIIIIQLIFLIAKVLLASIINPNTDKYIYMGLLYKDEIIYKLYDDKTIYRVNRNSIIKPIDGINEFVSDYEIIGDKIYCIRIFRNDKKADSNHIAVESFNYNLQNNKMERVCVNYFKYGTGFKVSIIDTSEILMCYEKLIVIKNTNTDTLFNIKNNNYNIVSNVVRIAINQYVFFGSENGKNGIISIKDGNLFFNKIENIDNKIFNPSRYVRITKDYSYISSFINDTTKVYRIQNYKTGDNDIIFSIKGSYFLFDVKDDTMLLKEHKTNYFRKIKISVNK